LFGDAALGATVMRLPTTEVRVRSKLAPRLIVSALALVLAVGGAGCASSAKAGPPAVTPTTIEVAGPNPSVSAQMVCGEAKTAVAAAVGVDTARPLAPKWSRAIHLYSCVYAYGAGKQMTLSVKEMSSPAETTAYFDRLGKTLHRTKDVALGEGAFSTRDGSIVVRKDYRVMLVDVSRLPAQFGIPAKTRTGFAILVASAIMQCWTGE
jgi:hypothetical protein